MFVIFIRTHDDRIALLTDLVYVLTFATWEAAFVEASETGRVMTERCKAFWIVNTGEWLCGM